MRLDEQLLLVDSLGLPIGWTQAEACAVFGWACVRDAQGEPPPGAEAAVFFARGAFWSKLLGVLLTTFALTFGAPFWFDLLNQLVNLRTSLKPKAAPAAAGGATANSKSNSAEEEEAGE